MKRKLLFIVNVDWFFISHRLPIALKALQEGYEVHLACAITSRQVELERYGIQVHPLQITRSGTSILSELKVLSQLSRVIHTVKPNVAHMITIKGVIYGGLITRLFRVKNRIASISGLGYVFIDNSIKARILRTFTKLLYKLACGNNVTVIFQNKSDESLFFNNQIIKSSQSVLIRGSGVCLNKFNMVPEPKQSFTVMFLARLLKDKGVVEFCEAAKKLSKLNDVRFVLVGDLDPENPNSLTRSQLATYVSEENIEHWGFIPDVENVIPKSNIIVLPSYREGLPKSLIEAAACGRAVITTDVPGCRDAIDPGKTGLLVPVKNVNDLTDAIELLLKNTSKRHLLAAEGRALAERSFDINDVVKKHLELYREKS
tara:strand:+ start:9533 stop:10648 length:1116 start_codon:yes stop_codon:yes gene_type:complete